MKFKNYRLNIVVSRFHHSGYQHLRMQLEDFIKSAKIEEEQAVLSVAINKPRLGVFAWHKGGEYNWEWRLLV